MAVEPAAVTLTGGNHQTFHCDAHGVTWSISPSLGEINPASGTYTAPPKYKLWISSNVLVTARDGAHHNCGTASILLSAAPSWMTLLTGLWVGLFFLLVFRVVSLWPPPPAVTSVEVTPPVVTLSPTSSQQFDAKIWNSRDQGVTWTATEGLITPAGLFTAPQTGSRVILTAARSSDHELASTALVILKPKGLLLQPLVAWLRPPEPVQFKAVESQILNPNASGSVPPATPAAPGKVQPAATPPGGNAPATDAPPQQQANAANTSSGLEWKVSNASVTISDDGKVEFPKQITELTRVVITAIDKADRERQASAVLYIDPTNRAPETEIQIKELLRDKILIQLVLYMGALGALLGACRSFANYVGNRTFVPSWSLFYLLRPIFGAGLAALVFFGYRIGAVTGFKDTSPADPFAAAFIAGMVGLFADTVLQKLKDLMTALFLIQQDDRKDKIDHGVAGPSITSADGSVATKQMAIKGKGFVSGATVTLNGQARQVTFVDAGQLTVALDVADKVGPVKVVVTNPDKQASAEFAGTIHV